MNQIWYNYQIEKFYWQISSNEYFIGKSQMAFSNSFFKFN